MMNKLRNWYMGFMQGRYGERGMDEFGRFLNIATIVFILLSMIFRKVGIFYWIALALLIYEYYRILSRDFAKRRRENDRYLQIRYNRGAFFEDAKKKRRRKNASHLSLSPLPSEGACAQRQRPYLHSLPQMR